MQLGALDVAVYEIGRICVVAGEWRRAVVRIGHIQRLLRAIKCGVGLTSTCQGGSLGQPAVHDSDRQLPVQVPVGRKAVSLTGPTAPTARMQSIAREGIGPLCEHEDEDGRSESPHDHGDALVLDMNLPGRALPLFSSASILMHMVGWEAGTSRGTVYVVPAARSQSKIQAHPLRPESDENMLA